MIDRTRTRLIRSSFRDRAEGVAAAAAILRELRAEAILRAAEETIDKVRP